MIYFPQTIFRHFPTSAQFLDIFPAVQRNWSAS